MAFESVLLRPQLKLFHIGRKNYLDIISTQWQSHIDSILRIMHYKLAKKTDFQHSFSENAGDVYEISFFPHHGNIVFCFQYLLLKQIHYSAITLLLLSFYKFIYSLFIIHQMLL